MTEQMASLYLSAEETRALAEAVEALAALYEVCSARPVEGRLSVLHSLTTAQAEHQAVLERLAGSGWRATQGRRRLDPGEPSYLVHSDTGWSAYCAMGDRWTCGPLPTEAAIGDAITRHVDEAHGT